MPNKDDKGEAGGRSEPAEDAEPWTPGASIGRDGKVVGIYLPQDPPRPTESCEKRPQSVELELVLPAPQIEEPPPAPEAKRPAPKRETPVVAIGVALLALCTVLGLALLRLRARPLRAGDAGEAELPAPARTTVPAGSTARATPDLARADGPAGNRAMIIESEPSGATVFLGAEELGKTPLVESIDLRADDQLPLRVELPGYQTWTATVMGGSNVNLHAKLQRLRRK